MATSLDHHPQTSTQLARFTGLSRRELYFWLIGGLTGNLLIYLVDLSSPTAVLRSLSSLNLILWFSLFVISEKLAHSPSETPASRGDIGIAVFVGLTLCLSALFGVRWGIGIPATATALFLIITYSKEKETRCLGIVLMALSVHLFWAPIMFQLLYPEFLAADAAAVGLFLSIVNPDINIINNTLFSANGHAVTLSGACSSFNNLSLAMLGCISMIMFVRGSWQKSDAFWMALICLLMISMNVTRLGILAFDFETYKYWHDDAGASIIGISESLVILGASLAAAYHGQRDNQTC